MSAFRHLSTLKCFCYFLILLFPPNIFTQFPFYVLLQRNILIVRTCPIVLILSNLHIVTSKQRLFLTLVLITQHTSLKKICIVRVKVCVFQYRIVFYCPTIIPNETFFSKSFKVFENARRQHAHLHIEDLNR